MERAGICRAKSGTLISKKDAPNCGHLETVSANKVRGIPLQNQLSCFFVTIRINKDDITQETGIRKDKQNVTRATDNNKNPGTKRRGSRRRRRRRRKMRKTTTITTVEEEGEGEGEGDKVKDKSNDNINNQKELVGKRKSYQGTSSWLGVV